MLQPYTHQFIIGNKVQLLHYADKVLPSTEWFDEWIFWTNLFCELILVIFFFFQMNCFWPSYRRDQEGFKTQRKFIEVWTFVFGLLGLPSE